VTERLTADPAGVSVLAAQVADETGIPAEHVEKDFWVTEVLRDVVASATRAQVVIVFKGGTSLSKAYRLIERFSEDVDVLVVLPDDTTRGKRDGILKTLVHGAAAATGLVPVVVPGATTKRGARFVYTAGHAGGLGLSEGVFLELGSVGGAMPCEQLSVTSLIASAPGTASRGRSKPNRWQSGCWTRPARWWRSSSCSTPSTPTSIPPRR
jgi:hypothetical protein